MTARVIDLSAERSPAPVRGVRKIKTVRGWPVVRRPEDITGIVIHQTACDFGAKPGQPRYREALEVACHALAFKTGEAVIAAPLLWYVQHGNKFNAYSLGLEIEGHYPGAPERGPGTDRLTVETLEAAHEALAELVVRGRALGMPLRNVWAHRQSSATRRADPGWEIWKNLRPSFARLGLTEHPDLAIGTGRPIPREWGGQAAY